MTARCARQPASTRVEFQVVTPTGTTKTRDMGIAPWNPNIFTNRDYDANGTPTINALNADGSRNARENPVPPGSVISIFVNGIVPAPSAGAVRIIPRNGWRLVGQGMTTPFVTRLDLEVPRIGDGSGFACASGDPGALCSIQLQLAFDNGTPFSPIDGGWIFTQR